MPSNQAHVLPDANSATRAGWPTPQEGDMVTDPTSKRAMLYRSGSWQQVTAAAAYKLASSRTVTLTGEATGSTTTDLSGDTTIPVEVGDDLHNHPWACEYGWWIGSMAIGHGSQIPWHGSTGSGYSGGAHSGNSIRLGKQGWWLVGCWAMVADQTGAGRTGFEMWGSTSAMEACNHDSAGRWAGCPMMFSLSDGGSLITPYFNLAVNQTLVTAFFQAVWLRY